MKTLKAFLIRLLIIGLPLLGLYFYAQMAFEANSKKEHPTDAGLGIAILLFNLLLIIVIGLIVDLIKRLKRKQYNIALTNVPFLLLFSIPILYIHCQMSSYCEDCFCSWFIDFIKNL